MAAGFGDAVTTVPVTPHVDERGVLVAVDLDAVPFVVRRVFTVSGVPAGGERGGHRHRAGAQALFCVAGRVDVELRRDGLVEEVALVPGSGGLVLAAGVWSRQCYADPASTLLVLASEPFDPDGYEDEH